MTPSIPRALAFSLGLIVSAPIGPGDALARGDATSPALEWPLGIDPALTSTFGEHRFGYFHSGIDLTTWGETGVPLTALGDGSVHRVRASGVGYGRAIYLLLDDGPMVVYAHLERFAPELGAYVRAEQERLGRYEVDLRPEAGRFRFRRGEIVAWSGESGAGPPHLHLETRDRAGEVAVNPLLLLETPLVDTRAPRLVSLTLSPASPEALVDGEPFPVTRSLTKNGDGAYEADTTDVQGAVAMSVHVFDKAEGKELRLAIYALSLHVDGELVYRSVLDSLPYASQREVDLVYDAVRVADGQRRVRRLHRPRGSRIGVHDVGDGRVRAAPPGKHRTAVVTASDWFGNESRATFVLRTPEGPIAASVDPAVRPPDEAPSVEPPAFDVDLEMGIDHAVLVVTAPVPVEEIRSAEIRGASGAQRAHAIAIGEARAVVRFEPDSLGGPLELRLDGRSDEGRPFDAKVPLPVRVVHPDRASRLEAAGASLAIPAGAVYEPVAVLLDRASGGRVENDRLTRVSDVFRVGPRGLVLERSMRLVIAPTDTTGRERVGVYVRHPRRPTWIYMGRELEEEGVGADIRGTGRFCLIRDDAPPRVRWMRPKDGARVSAGKVRVRAGLTDVGSGFGWRGLTLSIDGEPVIAEWDPEAGVLQVATPPLLASGKHVVSVTVTDRAGNFASRQSTFTVVDQ